MPYILQFIDSATFMASSLSNFVNDLSEGVHRIKDKFGHDDKKCETCAIKYEYCDCFLEYINVKDDLIEYKSLCCNKNYQHNFDEKLKKRFFNTYTFSNHNNNKFILLLRKGVYPYEYMVDYAQAKRVCKDFEIKNIGEYHDLYLQSDILMLADVFENFRNMCPEMYELGPAKFI